MVGASSKAVTSGLSAPWATGMCDWPANSASRSAFCVANVVWTFPKMVVSPTTSQLWRSKGKEDRHRIVDARVGVDNDFFGA